MTDKNEQKLKRRLVKKKNRKNSNRRENQKPQLAKYWVKFK